MVGGISMRDVKTILKSVLEGLTWLSSVRPRLDVDWPLPARNREAYIENAEGAPVGLLRLAMVTATDYGGQATPMTGWFAELSNNEDCAG